VSCQLPTKGHNRSGLGSVGLLERSAVPCRVWPFYITCTRSTIEAVLQSSMAQNAPHNSNRNSGLAVSGNIDVAVPELQRIEQHLATQTALMRKMHSEVARAAARKVNANCDQDEMLMPLPADDGNIPVFFPDTIEDLKRLTKHKTLRLTESYGLTSWMDNPGRRAHLARFFGVDSAVLNE